MFTDYHALWVFIHRLPDTARNFQSEFFLLFWSSNQPSSDHKHLSQFSTTDAVVNNYDQKFSKSNHQVLDFTDGEWGLVPHSLSTKMSDNLS